MSETVSTPETSHDDLESPETGHEQANNKVESKPNLAPSAEKQHIDNDIERIRDELKNHSARVEMPQEAPKESTASQNPSKDLRNQALYRTLKNVRQHLSAPQRALSKVIHQSVVDSVSEVGSKTVARPSGILGGGICAFLGSLFFVLLAKHIGFRYNYLMFVIFFVGGFVVGLVLEMIIRLVHHPKQQS